MVMAGKIPSFYGNLTGKELENEMDFRDYYFGNSNQSIFNIHRSILMQGIDDDYEIIVVGGQPIDIEGVSQFEFDESIKPGWITKRRTSSLKMRVLRIFFCFMITFTYWRVGMKIS